MIRSADIIVGSDEGRHNMKTSSAHRAVQKARQSTQIIDKLQAFFVLLALRQYEYFIRGCLERLESPEEDGEREQSSTGGVQ